jgi:hypothetical protein
MQPNETVRMLFSLYADDAEMEAECHANQDELSSYIDAELDNLPAATLYPALHSQLASCESCRVAYEELKALLMMERRENFATPPVSGTFDFTYLTELPKIVADSEDAIRTERVVDHVTWRLTDFGRLIVVFSAEFMQSLQPVLPRPASLKSASSDLFAVSSLDIADDLKVIIAAREKRRDRDHCTITVDADIPSRGGWPHLGGTAVTLSIGGREVETLYTDALGKVVFDGIARKDLSQLAVIVTPS